MVAAPIEVADGSRWRWAQSATAVPSLLLLLLCPHSYSRFIERSLSTSAWSWTFLDWSCLKRVLAVATFCDSLALAAVSSPLCSRSTESSDCCATPFWMAVVSPASVSRRCSAASALAACSAATSRRSRAPSVLAASAATSRASTLSSRAATLPFSAASSPRKPSACRRTWASAVWASASSVSVEAYTEAMRVASASEALWSSNEASTRAVTASACSRVASSSAASISPR
mmetsp:Transcript_20046/g.52064  ORF Transcript_20046/g.52064 Transcript_20046/m.52064 type:complete len:230 (+) Transcript_20046:24-713(+)